MCAVHAGFFHPAVTEQGPEVPKSCTTRGLDKTDSLLTLTEHRATMINFLRERADARSARELKPPVPQDGGGVHREVLPHALASRQNTGGIARPTENEAQMNWMSRGVQTRDDQDPCNRSLDFEWKMRTSLYTEASGEVVRLGLIRVVSTCRAWATDSH